MDTLSQKQQHLSPPKAPDLEKKRRGTLFVKPTDLFKLDLLGPVKGLKRKPASP